MYVTITTSNGTFRCLMADRDNSPARHNFKALVASVGAGAQVREPFALTIEDEAGQHKVHIHGTICSEFRNKANTCLDLYTAMLVNALRRKEA